MGIPPAYFIKEIQNPLDPYQYVVYCGWKYNEHGLSNSDVWLDYFQEITGYNGYEYGGPWYNSITTNKIYFKEKDYPFFILKFGHMFGKRPWEVS